MADYIRPTPRNPILGLLADAMMGGLAYMEDPRRTQQMRGVGGLLSDTGIAQTIDRLASGEPLTKGKGFATRMKPETAAAAMTLAPEAVPIGRAAMAAARATKGLPVGASIRKVAPQEEALRLAQQRAALPVSEGGLGLPPNNTPMDRARAMGFNTEGFHGTSSPTKEVKAFRPYPNDESGLPGTSFALNPEETEAYWTGRWSHSGLEGGQVIPVLVRGKPPIDYLNLYEDVIENAKRYPKTFSGTNRMLKKAVKDADSVGVDYSTSIGGTEFSVLEPSRIRSRFAAFDPTRRNEPDLLAGALPFTALLDEETRAKLEEQLGGLLGR